MDLIPVTQWNNYHKWPTKSSLRYLIFHARENGLKEMKAILKINGRVLVDADKFFKWVEEKNQESWTDHI